MRFSIVVPVYNVAEYLPACLDSILIQDLSDCEIILVDDGSTDNESASICDSYAQKHGDKVRVIHQENQGLGGARNTGISSAKGEYLIFIDSDDEISADMIKTISSYVDASHADVYNFGYYICKPNQDPIPVLDNLPVGVDMNLKNTPVILEANPTAWTRAWKRDLFIDNKIKYPSRVWYEDIRTTTKLFACAKSIVAIPECFYKYNVRENSITHNKNVERNSEILEAFDDIISWYKSKGIYEDYKEEIERLAIEHIFIAGSVRVARLDDKSDLLNRFRNYMDTNFPNFNSNSRLSTLSKATETCI